MKIHSWPLLLSTIFICGMIPYTIYRFEGFEDFIFLLFLGYGAIDGLYMSFSKEAYDEEVEKQSQVTGRKKKVYRKLFGKFAPVAPYGPFLLLMLWFFFGILLPDWDWLFITFMVATLACTLWMYFIVRKHMDLLEEQENQQEGQQGTQ